MSRTCGTARERSQKVLSFLKKEKRGRRNPPYRQGKSLCGVLRFDGHLTGAIYCSKKRILRGLDSLSFSLTLKGHPGGPYGRTC